VGTINKLTDIEFSASITQPKPVDIVFPSAVVAETTLFGSTFGPEYDGYIAYLTVKQAKNDAILFETDKFLLTDLHETQDCRQAPVFVMTQALMYTSGRTHSMGAYNGKFLLNDSDGDSRSEFERDYHEFLKSDACLNRPEGAAYVQLNYRDQVRRGYIIAFEFNTIASEPNTSTFSFTMFIYDR
jgi:hypothetical protein